MQPGLSTHIFFDQRLHPGHLDTLLSAGARTMKGTFAEKHALQIATPIIVKYRDERTNAATALEEALR